MKKLYIISFLLILSSSNIFSQSGWFVSRPFPNTREAINDIHFLNSNTGFLATSEYGYPYFSYGRLYRTTNSGFNWNRILLDSLYYLNKICFIDNNTGFVFGSKLYKTTDSGLSWVYKGTGGFTSMSFVNSITGYACGRVDPGIVILSKTTNGGDSWSNFNTNMTGYYLTMRDLHFWNSNTGIIIGDHFVCAKTTNGGINWSLKLPQNYGIYYDLEVVSDSICYITSNSDDSTILRSNNYGENWSIVHAQLVNQLYSVDFFSQQNGYAVGIFDLALRSTNGGNNWIPFPSPFLSVGTYNKLSKILSTTINNSYIIGEYGSLALTTNGGSNWEVLIRGDTLKAIHFVNRSIGFVAGSKGHLLKSTDGGSNWSDVQSGTTNTINKIYFKDSLNGIYVGNSGTVGKTTNSGLNWFLQSLNNSIALRDFYGRNDTGLTIGSNGKIYKTTNFGNNWIEKPSGLTLGLYSICLSNGNTIQVVGDSGVVLRSSNFGENWLNGFVTPRKRLNSISFSNLNIGFIVGDTGRVYKSTNGGLNWNLELPITGNNLKFINFINQNTGYIIGSRSTTMKTTNGGINWGFQSMGVYQINDNNRIFVADSVNMFIVGENSYVFKSTDGGGSISYPIGIEPVSIEIPDKYQLFQNNPNPFNPTTKIKFGIPSQSNAKIIIYDLLGREVTTLVNEQLRPGTYEVDWDGSGFASGVYFYSLVTNDFVEAKRMVLIK